MNKEGLSLKNLWGNLSFGQKLGLMFAGIILILVFVLIGVLVNNDKEDSVNNEPNVVEETYTDDGYTVTTQTYINDEGEEVTTGTKEDEYGNVTTLNPELITTYFPYQKMREHGDDDSTLQYFLSVDDESKTINALIEYCDIEADKVLVEEYINGIPLDLSEYSVVYETFSEDAICAE